MFLGEAFFGELISMWEERQEEHEEQRHAAFITEQTERFAERLAFGATAPVASGWQQGQSPQGHAFWLDEASGLIWSDALPMSEVAPDAVLPQARRTCAAYAPPGVWALPTDAEGFFLWRNGGNEILPRRRGRFVSERLDTDFELSIPVIHIIRGGTAGENGQAQDRLPWVVRCVALSSTAPRRGYLELDIARDDWNAYQLAKLSR
jgi:hypothetical protein